MPKVLVNNKRFKVEDKESGIYIVTLKGWYWSSTPRLMEALKSIIVAGRKISFIRYAGATLWAGDRYMVITQ